MRVASIIDISLVDVPGIPVAVLFTAGCNMDCSFCQNAEIIPRKSGQEMSISDIVNKLSGNLTDGYCITGGEPTIHKDLHDFLKALRLEDESKHINLNTQGLIPTVLEQSLPYLDSVWFDIKTIPSRYREVVRVKRDPWPKVVKSIQLLLDSGVRFWPRTTYVGGMTQPAEILKISGLLSEMGFEGDYLVQNFKKSSGTREKDVSDYYEPDFTELESIVDDIPTTVNLKLEWR
ncbi:MAG: anaerobic ribonucleoside-triphosphate reductase activating protein [Candidatus Thorarchaeota archaeon]|nr:MAG: anaerobic ribonucleoside-triphosphate reductase activating protein [Candidatus Thorarchaeota archaeon]